MRKKNIFTRKELIEIFREIHSLHSAVYSAEFFQGWDKAVGACEEEFTQKAGITVSDLCEEAGSVNDPVNHPSHYCDGIETIDFIESKHFPYHIASAVKYLSRAGKKDPARVFCIEDLLGIFFDGSAFAANVLEDDETEIRTDCLYACTNDVKMNGAGAVLYDGVLKRFAEKAGCDIYILPSSVHEVLLVASAMGIKPEDLKKMVKDVNRTTVSKEDFLSDNVFVYRRLPGVIEVV